MKPTNLIELYANRAPADVVLKGLTSKNAAESKQAGLDLVDNARALGVDIRDYLRLAIDHSKGAYAGAGLDGYETALAHLNLPLHDDFSKGVILQAAADTFQTFPGVRAMFPVVMDDIVQWKYRQEQLESVTPLLSQTRTIAGTELITTVIDDKAEDYQAFGMVDEGQRVAIRSIRATERSVKINKFGGGYRTTYEFSRRASLDIMTPYALRGKREIEIAKTASATAMLLNGDGVHGTPAVYAAATLGAAIGTTTVAGKMNWDVFLKFLIERAKAGVPVDTIAGNYDMHFEWLRMFATPTANMGPSQSELLQKAGVQTAIANPQFKFSVNFALASAVPAATLLGFSKADTLEELVETGSDISESERSIQNQVMNYVSTTSAGYRLVFGDTRATLSLN